MLWVSSRKHSSRKHFKQHLHAPDNCLRGTVRGETLRVSFCQNVPCSPGEAAAYNYPLLVL